MPIRIKVDEDLPTDVADALRKAGHDVLTVIDQQLCGTPDDRLWSSIQGESRCLFTADKGFANAAAHPPGSHYGIVLLRHPRESRLGYVALIDALLAGADLDIARGAIVVVTPEAIRIHRGPQSPDDAGPPE